MQMKRTVAVSFVCLLAIFLVVPGLSLALTGGPDSYGYKFYDSHEEGAPPFSWRDVPNVPTKRLHDEDADIVWPDVGIGFKFNFYGKQYETVHVGSNGLLTFDPRAVDYGSQRPPDEKLPDRSSPNSVIAGFWDFLRSYAG